MWYKLNLLDSANSILSFLSEIIITFVEFFFIIFSIKVFVKVSTVLPDFEITKKSTLVKFSFF